MAMSGKMRMWGLGVCLGLALCGRGAQKDIFTDGEFFVGCNYWAKNAGMYMWRDWRPDVVEAEIAALAKHGVTVMRVFPLWSEFQPLTGVCNAGGAYKCYLQRDRPLENPAGVDGEMVRRFRFMCEVAERNGVSLIVGIVTGWMSGRQFVPPVFEEKNVLTDPEAIMWQTRFVRHFVSALKDHKAIVAWDYGNECNCMGATSQAQFYNWMDHIGSAIRLTDPTRPVVSGMHGLSTRLDARAPIRLNGELSDILCTHPYSFYVPGCGKEAFNTMRTELHPTAESLLYRDLGGRPCFIEELGNLGTSCNSDARTAAGMRCTLFSAWANDLKGCLWWCNSDQEVLDFQPYTETPNERELGMLRQDLSPKPVMLEMRDFQRFRASLPFRKLPPRRTDAVIVVPERSDGWIPGFGAYLLARQAGIDPSFAGAEHELPDSGLYIVCSAEGGSSYTYPAQKRIFAKAESGATVLVIYSAAARFTHMRQNTGLEVDYCALSPMERTFELAEHPGRRITCADSGKCRLIARECEVMAKTAEGEPVLTRFRRGKGTVMVCNAPIDRQAIARTDCFTGERVQPYHLVMRAAARTAGLRHVVEKGDCPYVCLTEHPAKDGATIVMAINFEPRAMDCPVKMNGSLGRVWLGEVRADRIALPPNSCALFEVK